MNIYILDSWLREHLKTDAKPRDIAKYVSLCGPTFDRTEKYNNDWLYDVEITTNRVDAMSVYGIAREAAAILPQFGIKARLKPLKINKITQKKDIGIKIVNDEKLCHRILAVKLEKAKLGNSPKLIQKRLIAAGQRPLNNAIDITNYIMWEIGHPIHVFDYDKVGKNIIVREAKKGEKITTLDNKTYQLMGGEVIFDNGKGKIIDLPGIMGTANSVVTKNTKNLLLWIESVDPTKIRYASMGLSIRSQAAILNEKSVDPELGLTAILAASELLQKTTQAKVASRLVDIYPNRKKTKTLKTDINFIQDRLGVEISKTQISDILKSLEFEPKWKENQLITTVPSFRNKDVGISEDIIEEIARIYGYHKLPSEIMKGEIPVGNYDSPFKFENRLKEYLCATGGNEVYTYSLVPKNWVDQNALRLKNPLGTDTEYLRTSLLSSLVDAARKNRHEKNPFHLFEVANVYRPRKGDLPEECMMLAGVFFDFDYREAKGIIEGFLENIRINASLELDEKKYFKPSHYLSIKVDKETIGELGVLENDLIYYEFEVEKLRKKSKPHSAYKPIPKYPAQIEDITLILPERTRVGDVVHSIKSSDKLISKAELVDIYKDAYTFRVNYLHPNKTLTDLEVEKVRGKMLKQVKKKFGATLKKLNL
jgi:phenylalanyl-tRNA synthetase beta chain